MVFGPITGTEIFILYLVATFTFFKNQTLLCLYLRWYLPDVSQKVYPFKLLKDRDVEHIAQEPKILYERTLEIEVVIIKIVSHP